MTENTENPRRYVTGEDSEEDYLKMVVDKDTTENDDFGWGKLLADNPRILALVRANQSVDNEDNEGVEITENIRPIKFEDLYGDFDEAYFIRQYLKSFALGLLFWTAIGFAIRMFSRMVDANDSK